MSDMREFTKRLILKRCELMGDERNCEELEFSRHILFWREFKIVDGKRIYGRFSKSLGDLYAGADNNFEAVTVGDLYKDLYKALCKRLNLPENKNGDSSEWKLTV